MLLHPGVLALLTGSTVTLLLLFMAAVLGWIILRKWDIKNSSEEQLLLERRTYLVSTLVKYGFLFEIVSIFVFIYTADDLHRLLVGAMCATGSLNANGYGFPALYAGIASCFVAAAWIALDHLDTRAEDYPLTKKKYALLVIVLPFLAAEYVLRLLYFFNLEPAVITSCCGVLFSEDSSGLASSLASLPAAATRTVFYAAALVVILIGVAAAKTGRRIFLVLLSAGSAVFFLLSVASVISFISLYFYQLPTHHCPLDLLQKVGHGRRMSEGVFLCLLRDYVHEGAWDVWLTAPGLLVIPAHALPP